jgi:hypothetical protein
MNTHGASVITVALCAISDLAAAPLLLNSDDVPAGFGVGVVVIGVLTLVAAFAVRRQLSWSRPLAIGTRLVDAAAAIPAVTAGIGAAATSAAIVTVVLSIVAIVFLLHGDRRTVRTS